MPIHALDGPKANLRRIALTQLAAKCSGDNLMPQAHAKHRLAYGHRRFGQLSFGLQPGIFVIVERPHRPAHNHHTGKVTEVGKIGLLRVGNIHNHRIEPEIFEGRQNTPGALPRDMLQNQHLWCGHGSYCDTSVPRLR